MPHQLRALAFAARARANRLRTVSRRNRKSHSCCVWLAIPTHCCRDGRNACLCGQSATSTLSNRSPRCRVHRQHRLQRLPDSENCYQRCGTILHNSLHRSHVCDRASRGTTLRLHRRSDSLPVDRTSVLASSSKVCACGGTWFAAITRRLGCGGVLRLRQKEKENPEN